MSKEDEFFSVDVFAHNYEIASETKSVCRQRVSGNLHKCTEPHRANWMSRWQISLK